MTTIAWRDGVLAADSQATGGGIRYKAKKLFKLNDGRVVGFAGDYAAGRRFVEALTADLPFKPRPKDDFIALVMQPDGRLFEYENGVTGMPVLDRFHAIGSGAELALGAMACGKSAVDAVKIASQFDTRTGGRVQAVAAKGKKK